MRRRALAGELKNLRLAAGLTHVDVAHRLGWQQGKVSKIESAKQGVGIEAVIALADICRAPARHRDRLVGLARAARARGWWEEYRDVLPGDAMTYVGLEAEVASIRAYGCERVPDFLQTEPYARAALEQACRGAGPGAAGRRLEVLRRRRRNLYVLRPCLRVVLSESALRREVGGPAVLRQQLLRLLELRARHDLDLRVLAFSAGAHPAAAPFRILGFPAELHPDVVWIDDDAGGHCIEEAAALRRHRDVLAELESLALPGKESARFIGTLAEELGARTAGEPGGAGDLFREETVE